MTNIKLGLFHRNYLTIRKCVPVAVTAVSATNSLKFEFFSAKSFSYFAHSYSSETWSVNRV